MINIERCKSDIEKCKSVVKSIEFHFWPMFTMWNKYILLSRNNSDWIEIKAGCSCLIDFPDELPTVSISEWNRILGVIFDDLKFLEWDNHYDRIDVMDGYEWGIRIALNRRYRYFEIYKGGWNAYPDCWPNVLKLFDPLIEKYGAFEQPCC